MELKKYLKAFSAFLTAFLLLSLCACGKGEKKKPKSEQYKIHIACVGDSLTQGVGATGWRNGDKSNAYPAQLQNLLGDNYIVENFGKGSSYIYNKAGRDETLYYPNTEEYKKSLEFEADIVIIMLGTNDARAVNNETDADNYNACLTKLVNTYKAFDTRPDIYILSGLTMELYDSAKSLDREPHFTNFIIPQQQSVASKLSCTFLDTHKDLYDKFITGKYYTADALHPNDDGYTVIAEYIKDNLNLNI